MYEDYVLIQLKIFDYLYTYINGYSKTMHIF